MILFSAEIKRLSKSLGFDLCGIARARALTIQKERFEKWIGGGYSSSMGYLRRNIDARFDPSAMLKDVKSVVVCAVNYKTDNPHPRIASFALNEDYHTTIGAMLAELAGALGTDTGYRAFVDSSSVAEKSWAVEAGLGWIGRNSLVITPEYGSMVMFGGLLIDREVDVYDKHFEGEKCGACCACIELCPAGAILDSRAVDTNICISRLTIERGGEPPGEALNGWLFGCDECQRCCPHNAKTPLAKNKRFCQTVHRDLVSDKALSAMTSEEFEARLGHTPLARCGIERIKKRLT